jgi:uncharacterized metal-binding protein
MDDEKEIIIIACSGIGKPYGTIGREVAYLVCEKLADLRIDTECLAAVAIEDEEVVDRVRAANVFAVDGCFCECCHKTLEHTGIKVMKSFKVWKFHQENKDLKPRTVTFLDEEGRKFSRRMAELVVARIRGILGGDE